MSGERSAGDRAQPDQVVDDAGGVCRPAGALRSRWLAGWDLTVLFLFAALLVELGLLRLLRSLPARHARRARAGYRRAARAPLDARAPGGGRSRREAAALLHRRHLPALFSAGRDRMAATIVVSSGLLAASPAELEGLLAHELAHIRNRDVAVQTISVSIAVAIVELARVGGYFQRGLLFLLAPVAATIEKLALSPRRELSADRKRPSLRLAARSCRRVAASRPGRLPRPVRCQPDHRAPLSGRPVRIRRAAGSDVHTHPPFRERLRSCESSIPIGRRSCRLPDLIELAGEERVHRRIHALVLEN